MWLLVAACELVKPFPRKSEGGPHVPPGCLERPLILARRRRVTKLSRKIVEVPLPARFRISYHMIPSGWQGR